jgi:hypothetical protein
MVGVEVRTADRRAGEMEYRIKGIGKKFWNIGVFDGDREYRSFPVNGFHLAFFKSAIAKTVLRLLIY